MTKQQNRAAWSIALGGVAMPAFIYFISGPGVWPWWMYALMIVIGPSSLYGALTEQEANERIADRED